MTQKSIVLTGVKPTGQIHLGNYLGAIKPALEFAKQPGVETWLFIADYHGLTTTPDPKVMKELTYEIAAAWLACGLDPERTVFYRQSDIPEILELNWVLACFCPKGLMNRAHSYKARVQENEQNGKEDLDFGVNMGLYNYPVLMSADILMFQADQVPVGEDQVQHLEIARDIAQKFNRKYGELLKVPNVVTRRGAIVTGLDGRKMSKSYDNYIPIFADPKRLRKLVMKIKSDSLPPEAPKETKDSIIFEHFAHFASPEQVEAMRARYAAGIAWGTAKEELFELLEEHFRGPRALYEELMADKGRIDKILSEGAAKARVRARANLEAVRRAIGID